MTQIGDALYLDISFDGKPYTLSEFSTVGSLQISSSVSFSLPVCSLSISDSQKFFKNTITLVDGLPFVIVLGKTATTAQKYYFRVFHSQEAEMANGVHSVSILAMYDAPAYINKSTKVPMAGPSSGALSNLAMNAGFAKFDIDNTNDSQVWRSANDKLHVLANKISAHGYIDATSCMRHAVTATGIFKYKNITKLTRTPDTPIFYHGDKPSGSTNSYLTADVAPINKSGYSNTVSGYKGAIVAQSFGQEATLIDSIQFQPQQGVVNMSKDIHDKTDSARVAYAPIDGGNTHPKYQEAQYQNSRIGHLYTNGIQFLTLTSQKYDVLDLIHFEHKSNTAASSTATLTGDYIVTGKTIYVSGTNYYEKYEAYSSGLNADNSNTTIKAG